MKGEQAIKDGEKKEHITSLSALNDLLEANENANKKLRAEVERLKSGGLINADELFTKFAGHSDYHGDTILCIISCMAEGKEVSKAIPLNTDKIKSEAIKEFAKKHREIIMAFCDDDDQISLKVCEYDANTDNLVKEMVGAE